MTVDLLSSLRSARTTSDELNTADAEHGIMADGMQRMCLH